MCGASVRETDYADGGGEKGGSGGVGHVTGREEGGVVCLEVYLYLGTGC